MSLSSKLFSGAIAVSAFAYAASAQDTKVAPNAGDRGVRKEMRHDGMGKGIRGDRRGPGGFALRGVNLTDAQKEQIRQIHEANKPNQAFKDEMRTLREAKRNGALTADQQSRLKSIRREASQKAKSIHEQVL